MHQAETKARGLSASKGIADQRFRVPHQAFMFRNVKRNVQRDRGVLLAFEDGF